MDYGHFVQINRRAIPDFAKKLKEVPLPSWNEDLQFVGNAAQTAHYYFLLDSINFCFWPEKGKEKWNILHSGQKLSGYYAFSLAIKKALEKNPKLWDAKYLANIPFIEFEGIFAGNGDLQLLLERHKIIQENFRIISENYENSVLNLVEEANHDVNKLVALLLADFISFRDIAEYHRQKIYFLKRAQIFCADLNQSLGIELFRNMRDLAVFSDYKLPQILEAEGVLIYASELKDKIAKEELIPSESDEEIEIRANTVLACEMILGELKKLERDIESWQLDWLLWTLAKETKFELPYHKTLSIYY